KEQQSNPIFRYRIDENYTRPFEAAFGFGDPDVSTNNTQFGVFLQDDWAITSKLTINLGVRWDVETNMINNDYVTPQPIQDSLRGPLRGRFLVDRPRPRADGTCCDIEQVDVIGQVGGLDRFLTNGRGDRPIYLGAWQPRLGASYDVFGNARTVFFGGAGIYYDRTYWNSLFDERFRRQYHVLRVNFNDVGPTPQCPLCVEWDPIYYDPDELRQLAGTAGLDELFLVANDLKPPKTHQFTAGIRQAFGNNQLTLSYNGVRGFDGFNYVKATNWGGLAPTYSQAFVTDDRVKTWYDAVQFQVERPLRRTTAWGGSFAYTFSTAESRGRIDDFFWDFNDQHPTVADMPRQRAPNNQAHTIVAHGIARLPFEFLGSAILNLGSGLTSNATDASAGWDFWKQTRYVYEPPKKPFLGMGRVFSTQSLDLRLQKDFTFVPGQSASLVLDLFNAFNSENWGCYRTTIKPPSDPNQDIGIPDCSGPGRRVQVGLRYGYRPRAE
ncbi:MAG TPA: TonB-dependent receptor, partial [Gemmatimonadaceae bacterium]|nr:TonB-dependent receptor [Gemmatimonadaceae bacterium]